MNTLTMVEISIRKEVIDINTDNSLNDCFPFGLSIFTFDSKLRLKNDICFISRQGNALSKFSPTMCILVGNISTFHNYFLKLSEFPDFFSNIFFYHCCSLFN